MNAKVLAVGLGTLVFGGAIYLGVTAKKAKAATRTDVARAYYRPKANGMSDELYARYESCMKGLCDADTATALADELESLGFKDHSADLLELVADMLGLGTAPIPAEPPTQVDAAQEARDTAAALVGVLNTQGCGALTREETMQAQRILGVNQTGIYDAETAVKLAAMGYTPPPIPCEFPLPRGWDTLVDQWAQQIANAAGV